MGMTRDPYTCTCKKMEVRGELAQKLERETDKWNYSRTRLTVVSCPPARSAIISTSTSTEAGFVHTSRLSRSFL